MSEQDVQVPGWVDPRPGRADGQARREWWSPEGEPGGADRGSRRRRHVRRRDTPRGAAPAADDQPAPEPGPVHHPTAPVEAGARPRPRPPRRDPLIRMGPWAPVAGAAIGCRRDRGRAAAGPAVGTFDQRLALVFVVLGLTLLGAGGTLLADEVRLLRRGAQAAQARAGGRRRHRRPAQRPDPGASADHRERVLAAAQRLRDPLALPGEQRVEALVALDDAGLHAAGDEGVAARRRSRPARWRSAGCGRRRGPRAQLLQRDRSGKPSKVKVCTISSFGRTSWKLPWKP